MEVEGKKNKKSPDCVASVWCQLTLSAEYLVGKYGKKWIVSSIRNSQGSNILLVAYVSEQLCSSVVILALLDRSPLAFRIGTLSLS